MSLEKSGERHLDGGVHHQVRSSRHLSEMTAGFGDENL
jgi:hypothetical protein